MHPRTTAFSQRAECGLFFFLLILGCLSGAHSTAEVSSSQQVIPEVPSPNPVLEKAAQLLETGRTAEAMTLLKAGLAGSPEAKALTLLLVSAYLRDGNDLWALRTVLDYHERHPDDCEVLSWGAWLFLKQGSLEEVRDLLAPAGCWDAPPLAARRSLLLAFTEHHARDEKRVLNHLEAARGVESVFPEDRAAVSHLLARDPGYLAPLSGRLELVLGSTSNVFAGSPVDRAVVGAEPGSGLVQTGLWFRQVAPTGHRFRPAVELDIRSLGYTSTSGRDLSYLLVGGRPGVVLGWSPQALLAYRYEGLLLAGGDQYDSGPLWYFQAHRGEFEAAILSGVTMFGGAGHRGFRELGRTRTEVDGGLGGQLGLSPKVRTLGALTGRWHAAEITPYDLWGGSALLSAEVGLPKGWSARALTVLGLDRYPRSDGYFDVSEPTVARGDLLLKLGLSALSPQLADNLRLVTGYEFSQRFSTTAPYRYQDHRLLVKLQWSFSLDPWLPRPVSPEQHVALEYGLGSAAVQDRIQDLLRQDEAAQRSSSCVK